MRPLRIAAYAAAGLIGLIVVALVCVVVFVDPNDYRDDIEKLVEQKTGRELTLGGELKLSVFPWIALETGPASLGDGPGFGPEPFVSIKEAHVGVRLLPLLRGKIEVGNVKLDGARIRLITDESGRENWADLGKTEAQPANRRAKRHDGNSDGRRARDQRRGCRDGEPQAKKPARSARLPSEDRPARVRRDVPSHARLRARPGPLAVVEVKLAADVTADLERNAHRLAEPKIDLTVSGPGYPADGVPVEVRAKSLKPMSVGSCTGSTV